MILLLTIFSTLRYINSFFAYYFRAIMTHASVPKDQRERLGISDTLVRCKSYCLPSKCLIVILMTA